MRVRGGGGGDGRDASPGPGQDETVNASNRTETRRNVPGSKSEKSATRKNVFSIARDVFRREAAARLFAGCGARVAAVAPGSAISFFVYEGIKEWMNA